MPLISLAVLAYAAGLMAGFLGNAPAALAALAPFLARGLWARDARFAGLALIGAAGVFAAGAAERSQRRCDVRALAARSWYVQLDDPASPGAYVRGRVDGGCQTRIGLAVQRGSAPAGARVRVTGDAVPGGRGVLVRHASIHPSGRGGVLPRMRAEAGRRIDALFESDAPLARALLIADDRAIPPDVIQRFAAAGLVHALSISGLHVGIIAMAAQLLLRILRLSTRGAVCGAALITAAYVAMIGAPAPAVRSGAMFAVMAASRLLRRPSSPWAALAIGALVPLFNARTVMERGYQLSVIGIAGLIAGGTLVRRLIAPRLDGIVGWVTSELTRSTVTTLVTTPLVAWAFGCVSIVAPLTNLMAAPLFGIVQPMLFLALLMSPIESVARFIAHAAHPLLRAIDRIAGSAAAVPGASLIVAPTVVAALCMGLAAVALVAACVNRFPARACATAVLALALAVWEPLVPSSGGAFAELHMIDVGQGDALALRTPRGRWLLFDAGRAWAGGDAGRSTLIPYLRRQGGELRAVILSHAHADHVGGIATIVRALRPEEYWDAAFAQGSDVYRESLDAAFASGVRWRRVHPGDSIAVDGVLVRFLAPDSSWTAALSDPNEASTVASIEFGAVRFLLTGDAERREEAWLLAHDAAALRADVLKVAHHGSSTSTTPAFLDAVHPRVALVSVGAGNPYGHPNAGILESLGAEGAVVLRTDKLGTVVVRTDGHSLTVRTTSDSWTVPR